MAPAIQMQGLAGRTAQAVGAEALGTVEGRWQGTL